MLAWHNFFTEFRFYNPVAVIYFAEVTDSYSLAMAVFSIIIGSSMGFEVPTGMLSDRIGRKYTLLLSSVTFALSLLCYALAQDFTFLVIGALVAGLSEAFYSGNNNALIYESLKQVGRKDDFGHVYGRLGAMIQMALGSSAVIGGVLLGMDYSLRLLVWFSLLSQLVPIILTLFIVEPRRAPEQASTNIFKDLKAALVLFRDRPRLRWLTIANSIQFGLGEASHRFTAAFIQMVWPLWAVSGLAVIRNIFGAIGFWIAGRVNQKWGELRTLMGCSFLMSGFSILAVLLSSIISPVLIYVNNMFYGFGETAKEHLFQNEFSDHQRATMGSLTQFTGSLFFVLAAMALGVIADQTNPARAFLTAMVVRLPVIGIYWHVYRRH